MTQATFLTILNNK